LIGEPESLRGDVAELRHETELGFDRLEKLIERRTADRIKWSFVFCVSALLSVAVLAGMMR
jgi:hypothetical protein